MKDKIYAALQNAGYNVKDWAGLLLVSRPHEHVTPDSVQGCLDQAGLYDDSAITLNYGPEGYTTIHCEE